MNHVLAAVVIASVVLSQPQGARPAPTPTLLLTPASPTLASGAETTVYVAIANPSTVSLSNLQLAIRSAAFELKAVERLGRQVPPNSTAIAELKLQARERFFGVHAIIVTLDYTWADGAVVSAASTVGSTSLSIKQPFEEEAKGLPGGTAALLYLLLPVIPAFLAYQLVEQLRTRSAIHVPVFRAEHIPFAFFVALVIGVARLVIDGGDPSALTKPSGLASMIAVSAAVGAFLPGVRWLREIYLVRRWGFRENDTLEAYLRKAMHARQPTYRWVSGKIGETRYEGIGLVQPDGRLALGAALQVSPGGGSGESAKALWSEIVTRVVDETGRILDRKRLVDMVKTRALVIQHLRKVQVQGVEQEGSVIAPGIEKLDDEEQQETPFIKPVR